MTTKTAKFNLALVIEGQTKGLAAAVNQARAQYDNLAQGVLRNINQTAEAAAKNMNKVRRNKVWQLE